ncbi:MAG: ABC transporter permease [Nocardioidaceae bacterium]
MPSWDVEVQLLYSDGASGVRLADALQPDHQIFATVHGVTLLPALAPHVAETPRCYIDNSWWCPAYWSDRQDVLTGALWQHVWITVASVALGLILAFPLALLARRFHSLESLVVGGTTIVYTIPSLALFSLLLPATGLSATTVIIGLALYSLDDSGAQCAGRTARSAQTRCVSPQLGNGYGPTRLLVHDRAAAGPARDHGRSARGDGFHGRTGHRRLDRRPTAASAICCWRRSAPSSRRRSWPPACLCVLLAILLDLVLVVLQHMVTPWTRVGARA